MKCRLKEHSHFGSKCTFIVSPCFATKQFRTKHRIYVPTNKMENMIQQSFYIQRENKTKALGTRN